MTEHYHEIVTEKRWSSNVYTALCMTMILDSEKLNPQYNRNSVLTIPWIAWGVPGPPSAPPLTPGLLVLLHTWPVV